MHFSTIDQNFEGLGLFYGFEPFYRFQCDIVNVFESLVCVYLLSCFDLILPTILPWQHKHEFFNWCLALCEFSKSKLVETVFSTH